MITIRPEHPGDAEAISRVNELALGRAVEGAIVDRLRQTCSGYSSLVSDEAAEVVGHILCTPAAIEGSGGTLVGVGSAPRRSGPTIREPVSAARWCGLDFRT